METFQLPGNDARFLQLTTPEVLEQILLLTAAREWKAELGRKKRGPHYDDRTPYDVESEISSGEEARQLADTPHLTGDPEFDEIELNELKSGKNWAAEYQSYTKERHG